jgi:hypothetical protein
MTWGIVLFSMGEKSIARRGDCWTYPLKATIQREPLVGSRRKAKSLEGSHISVTALGRYVPTEAVRFFVRFSDRLRRLDLGSRIR